jgi:TPR repeat protein
MNAQVRQLMESASRGNAASQRELAERLYYGRGVKRNVSQAIGWLMLAAKNGDEGANFLVCQLCKRGILPVAMAWRS